MTTHLTHAARLLTVHRRFPLRLRGGPQLTEVTEALNKKHGPLYVRDQIPAKTYPGQDKPAQILSVWNILAVNEKMSDATAYTIVKTLFEHKPDLVATHKEADNILLENQNAAHSPLPFHPGAIRYFTEKGVKFK